MFTIYIIRFHWRINVNFIVDLYTWVRSTTVIEDIFLSFLRFLSCWTWWGRVYINIGKLPSKSSWRDWSVKSAWGIDIFLLNNGIISSIGIIWRIYILLYWCMKLKGSFFIMLTRINFHCLNIFILTITLSYKFVGYHNTPTRTCLFKYLIRWANVSIANDGWFVFIKLKIYTGGFRFFHIWLRPCMDVHTWRTSGRNGIPTFHNYNVFNFKQLHSLFICDIRVFENIVSRVASPLDMTRGFRVLVVKVNVNTPYSVSFTTVDFTSGTVPVLKSDGGFIAIFYFGNELDIPYTGGYRALILHSFCERQWVSFWCNSGLVADGSCVLPSFTSLG